MTTSARSEVSPVVPEGERRFYDAALALLAEEGFDGLKLARVCRRVGVSTGPFYFVFGGWGDFTARFLAWWRAERSTRLIELMGAEPDPLVRSELAFRIALDLPHDAEAAIRVWAGTDPDARAVQDQVDRERLEAIARASVAALGDAERATALAHAAMYLLIGYEQAGPLRDRGAFEQALRLLQGEAFPRPSP